LEMKSPLVKKKVGGWQGEGKLGGGGCGLLTKSKKDN